MGEKNISWIGTGILGSAIIRRLTQKGYVVYAWNRTPEKAQSLIQDGIVWCAHLNTLISKADFIFLCLTDEKAINAVLFPSSNFLTTDNISNKTIVNIGTISPDFSILMHSRIKELGGYYIDCPVSGGPEGALEGTLTSIISGDQAVISKIEMIIQSFSAAIIYTGEKESAQYLKILNNLAESINLVAAAEVINLGVLSGFDLNMLESVLMTARGSSTYMGVLFDRLKNPKQEASVTLEIRLKDLRLINCKIHELGVEAPMTKITNEIFNQTAEIKGRLADQTECYNIHTLNNKEA